MLESPGEGQSAARTADRQKSGRCWLFCFALPLLALGLFVFVGFLLVPLLGLEDDEVIFVNIFWHPNDCFSRLALSGDHAIPGMVASYAGALKTWLYSPLLLFFSPTVWLVRVPALLLAVLAAALTGELVKQIAGEIAFAVALLLLATDVTFLVTALFDWGPVVLQHLLLVTSLLLLVQWFRTQRQRLLFFGGISVGLAVWDKSLFLWQIFGLSVAFLVVGFPVLRQVLNRRNVWMFARGLLLGALPLLIANFRHHFATIRDNGHVRPAEVSMKTGFLRSALDGQAATSFLVESASNHIDQIGRPLESLALGLLHSLGSSPSLWRCYPGIAITLLAVLLTRGSQRRWILFFLISGSVAWLQSALTLHAGNVVHHAVLIWVNWYCALSLSLTVLLTSHAAYIRVATALLIGLFCVRGVLVMGADYVELISHPGTPRWTNADVALAAQLRRAGIKRAIVTDWGIRNVLRVRSNDGITVENQGLELTAGSFDEKAFSSCISSDCVLVSHASGRNVFPLVAETLEHGLVKTRFRKVGINIVYDTHGVPSFETFHLSSVAASEK